MRWPRIIFLLIVLLLFGAFLHYNLPQRDVVRITQTESVREDFTSLNRWFYADNEDGTVASGNRDIRFINSVRFEDDRVMIYRNEDTGFGWPPYSSSIPRICRARPRIWSQPRLSRDGWS